MKNRAWLGAAILAGTIGGAAEAIMSFPGEEGRPGSTRNRPSGSQPVPGGGARERARRMAKMHDQPEPCCMWCGKEQPESGWHFLKYPQALCTKECADSFHQAF